MNDASDNELHDAVSRMATAVRPTHDATSSIHASVRRSRRRRAIGSAVGASGLVLALVAGGYAVSGAITDSRQAAPSPATQDTATPAPPDDGVFECATESRVFGPPPPIADLVEQEEIVLRLLALSSVQVHHAEPSALGVVALVAPGGKRSRNLTPDAAVAAKLEQLGAAHVYEWDDSEDSDFESPQDQVASHLNWLLDPAIEDIRTATRGIEGDAGLALWSRAGAVLLQWKTPVPSEVQDLAGARPDGVEVIVEGVDYSNKDVSRAQNKLPYDLSDLGGGEMTSWAWCRR